MRFAFACSLALLAISAVAASWSVSQAFSESVMSGITFTDPKTGFISGGDNGVGPQLVSTTDGGNTWNQATVAGGDLMILDVDGASDSSVVFTGIGILANPTQVTFDGVHFNHTSQKTSGAYTSQSVRVGGEEGIYGVTGAFGSVNGVAVSQDSGATWTVSDVKYPSVPTRYGAFPSANNWIVALGQWPSNGKKSSHIHEVSRNFKINRKFFQLEYTEDKIAASGNNTWAAVIQQTNDGGNTWYNTFNNDTFYFNQIACPSASTCYVVGENDDYAVAYKTTDGGNTWNELASWAGHSLMAVFCFDESECWLGGGEYDASFTGHAFHTTDGGATFVDNQLPGYYFNDFSFTSRSAGWATAFNALQQSSLLQFSN